MSASDFSILDSSNIVEQLPALQTGAANLNHGASNASDKERTTNNLLQTEHAEQIQHGTAHP